MHSTPKQTSCPAWQTPPWGVGEQAVEIQGLQLAAFVNDISAAVLAGLPRHEIREALNELIRMTEAHMALEEQLMRACDDGERHERHAVNDRFARTLSGTIAAYLTDPNSCAEPVLGCIRAWLQYDVRTEPLTRSASAT